MDDPEAKAAMEAESLKVLKRMGYPVKESLANPISQVHKILGVLTRRLNKMDEVVQELEDYKKQKQDKSKNKDPDLVQRATGTIDKRLASQERIHRLSV